MFEYTKIAASGGFNKVTTNSKITTSTPWNSTNSISEKNKIANVSMADLTVCAN